MLKIFAKTSATVSNSDKTGGEQDIASLKDKPDKRRKKKKLKIFFL